MGKYSTTKGTEYYGEFVEGMPHGQGIIEYYNGDSYEGQWKMNEKNG